MDRDDEKMPEGSVLGDIRPRTRDHERSIDHQRNIDHERDIDHEDESMGGGSQHDRSEHSGSRDVTEGTTGGTGTEVGGTRNYRQGTGATGSDIGNRPE